ncbi:hypothetical protein WICPIJ_005742 [Wickerhamomyces pijperi]|uniref:Uncharacterized protein n=1 Tax=Wickerhamomyces pijperi TaxID=599730 RepID=A0A9P8Q3D4_WICPI|nr:hypothetical protein WICPIJ_005742 [Wickerhamomyces pijperi]
MPKRRTDISQIGSLKKIPKRYPKRSATNKWTKAPVLLRKSLKLILQRHLDSIISHTQKNPHSRNATHLIANDLVGFLSSSCIKSYTFPPLNHNFNKNDDLERFIDIGFVKLFHSTLVNAYSLELKLFWALRDTLETEKSTLKDLTKLLSHYKKVVNNQQTQNLPQIHSLPRKRNGLIKSSNTANKVGATIKDVQTDDTSQIECTRVINHLSSQTKNTLKPYVLFSWNLLINTSLTRILSKSLSFEGFETTPTKTLDSLDSDEFNKSITLSEVSFPTTSTPISMPVSEIFETSLDKSSSLRNLSMQWVAPNFNKWLLCFSEATAMIFP